MQAIVSLLSTYLQNKRSISNKYTLYNSRSINYARYSNA